MAVMMLREKMKVEGEMLRTIIKHD